MNSVKITILFTALSIQCAFSQLYRSQFDGHWQRATMNCPTKFIKLYGDTFAVEACRFLFSIKNNKCVKAGVQLYSKEIGAYLRNYKCEYDPEKRILKFVDGLRYSGQKYTYKKFFLESTQRDPRVRWRLLMVRDPRTMKRYSFKEVVLR